MSNEKIVLNAIIYKLQTTVDSGWRLSLDLDQGQSEEIMRLSKMRDQVIQLEISSSEQSDTLLTD